MHIGPRAHEDAYPHLEEVTTEALVDPKIDPGRVLWLCPLRDMGIVTTTRATHNLI